jgi:hypothetical protein
MIREDIRVREVKELFDRWESARKDWEVAAREDIDFYLGNHFTSNEVNELDSRNQSSMPMDRLYAAI